MAKTAHLQIRVTPEQKRALKRLAREAGTDLSGMVLSRVLPDEAAEFQRRTALLRGADQDWSFHLAELWDWLRALPVQSFERAIARAPDAVLSPSIANQLAAGLELASGRREIAPPSWTAQVPVPAEPVFGSSLTSLRLYLLTQTPVALRRRNIFADASMDERV